MQTRASTTGAVKRILANYECVYLCNSGRSKHTGVYVVNTPKDAQVMQVQQKEAVKSSNFSCYLFFSKKKYCRICSDTFAGHRWLSIPSWTFGQTNHPMPPRMRQPS